MTEPGVTRTSYRISNSKGSSESNSSSPAINVAGVHARLGSHSSDTTDTDDDVTRDNSGLIKGGPVLPGSRNTSTSETTLSRESRVFANLTTERASSAEALSTDGGSRLSPQQQPQHQHQQHQQQQQQHQQQVNNTTSSIPTTGEGPGEGRKKDEPAPTVHAANVEDTLRFVGIKEGAPSGSSNGGPPAMGVTSSTDAVTTATRTTSSDGGALLSPSVPQLSGTTLNSSVGMGPLAVGGGTPGHLALGRGVVNNSNDNDVFPVPATPTKPTGQQQRPFPQSVSNANGGDDGNRVGVLTTSGAGVGGTGVASGGAHNSSQLFPKLIKSGPIEDTNNELLKTGTPRRRRLVRLDNGSVVVLPTNIYRQAAGVKLDLSLGGLRLDGERPTVKNRSFNFGQMAGINRENILALRAFRNEIMPLDRNNTIHYLAVVEALRRYDEEHLKTQEGSEVSSLEGDGGWIPDSREILFTVVGSTAERRVSAGELRSVDFPEACKRALEVLKADPDVLAGHLESAPDNLVTAKDEDILLESYSRPVSSISGLGENLGFQEPKRRGRKKKAVVAMDGNAYDLPKYVQHEKMMKNNRSTLKLKMPLSGYLVTGEEISVSDLVVAGGLDVTPKNILALRGARDTVMMNFAGPPAVQRVIAAEIFHYWYKRRCTLASSVSATAPKYSGGAAGGTANPSVDAPSSTDGILGEDGETSEGGADGFMEGGDEASLLSRSPLPAEVSSASTATAVSPPPPAAKSADANAQLPAAGAIHEVPKVPATAPPTTATEGGATTPHQKETAVPPMDVVTDFRYPVAAVNPANAAVAVSSTSAQGDAPTPESNAVSPAESTSPPRSVESSSALEAPPSLSNDDIIIISGPPADAGGTRLEVHMTVRDLIAARVQRTIVFRQLVESMMEDPVVQSGQLELVPQRSTTNDVPPLPAPPGGVGATAAESLSHLAHAQNQHHVALSMPHNPGMAMPISAGPTGPNSFPGGFSGVGAHREIDFTGASVGSAGQQQLDRQACADWSSGSGGSGSGAGSGGGAGTGRSDSWDPLAFAVADERGGKLGKRERETEALCNGGGKRPFGASPGGGGTGLGEGDLGFGVRSPLSTEATLNSKRRRQLWMREIGANERRYERRKEEAKRQFEARQQQLLRWMVNEEAGRHDALDGNAGPPPDDEMN